MAGDSDSAPSTSAAARDELPSSSASGGASPPTAAELARIAQQEAMMERLMERKLAMLEAEYNACINAEAVAQQQRTAAEEAARHGYGRANEEEEEEEEEFSPAWTQFKADMEEERLRQQAAGLDSDDGSERPADEAKEGAAEERPLHAPLTSDKISSIKSVMSGIKLRPPPWAVGMTEDVWMARILERAGFVRRAAQQAAASKQTQQGQQGQQPQQPSSEEERKRRKDKKKARKARKAREAKQQPQHAEGQQTAEAAPTSVATFTEDDFETSFPALPSPRSSSQPAVVDSSAVTQTA